MFAFPFFDLPDELVDQPVHADERIGDLQIVQVHVVPFAALIIKADYPSAAHQVDQPILIRNGSLTTYTGNLM
jgi:hypothetical protein